MRALLILASIAALAGCGQREELSTKTDSQSPTKAPASEWTLQVTSAGATLGHSSPTVSGPVSDLTLSCVRGGQFEVLAEQLPPVESEERLSLGAGGDAFALVASAAIDAEPPFVKAVGPIDETLLRLLETGMPISASYGATPIGPFAAPDQDRLRLFLTACRILAKEGQG